MTHLNISGVGFRSNTNFVLSMFAEATRIAQKHPVQASKTPKAFEAMSKARFYALGLQA
jgi:hypothetical protein